MKVLSYNPQDDMFWVGFTKSEFKTVLRKYQSIVCDRCSFERIIEDREYHWLKESYHELVKDLFLTNFVPYGCLAISRDFTHIFYEQSHFPFGVLWNAYSPWRNIKVVEIASLDELSLLQPELLSTSECQTELEKQEIVDENTKYYLISDRILGKRNKSGYFLFHDGEWVEDNKCLILDSLLGYDPTEQGPYMLGNIDIMNRIREIDACEASRFIKKN